MINNIRFSNKFFIFNLFIACAAGNLYSEDDSNYSQPTTSTAENQETSTESTENIKDPTTLDASETQFKTVEEIVEIHSMQSLKTLNLARTRWGRSPFIQDKSLQQFMFSKSFPSLKTLTIDDSEGLGVSLNANFSPNLEFLSAKNCPIILDSFQFLKVLHIEKNQHNWVYISGVLPNLEELYIEYPYTYVRAGWITNANRPHFPTYFPLSFPLYDSTPNLKNLSISNAIIYDAHIKEISKLTELHSLSISTIISNNSRDSLNSWEYGDSTNDLNDLKSLVNLDTLRVSNFDFVKTDLRFLATLPYLKKLEIQHGKFTADNIEQLGYTPLVHLDELIIGKSHVKGTYWDVFVPNVRLLNLDGSNVSASDLNRIGSLHNLEQLSLNETKISGQSIAKLAALQRLYKLSLSGTNMRNADFGRLSDRIEELDLVETELSIESFQTLYSLVHLKKLDLTGTQTLNITASMIESLQKVLPDCKILYCDCSKSVKNAKEAP